MPTSIEWTRNNDGSEGESWNPIRARNKETGKLGHACVRCSPGCLHCYAAAMNVWRGTGVDYTVPGFEHVELYLDAEALDQPLRWRKPRNVFVCSMTDLFADFVPDEWIAQVYAVEAACARHTFMHLTKRPARRLKFLTQLDDREAWANYLSGLCDKDGYARWSDEFECVIANAINGVYAPQQNVGWPMKHVREGTSVCTQKEADELVPVTLDTPAAVRWLSMEPLLEKIILQERDQPEVNVDWLQGFDGSDPPIPKLDWVVVGGESGRKARPTNVGAIRSVVRQCREAGVPCFVKQLGKRPFFPANPEKRTVQTFLPVKDAKGGEISEWPEDLRVREVPQN